MLCRVCLSCDAKHDIYSTRLIDVFERLTSIQMYSGDGKPHSVCALCLALLRKSHQLWRRALTADRLLERLLKDGHLINEDSVQDIDRQQYSLTHDLVMTTPEIIFPYIHVKTEPVDFEEGNIPSTSFGLIYDNSRSTDTFSECENKDALIACPEANESDKNMAYFSSTVTKQEIYDYSMVQNVVVKVEGSHDIGDTLSSVAFKSLDEKKYLHSPMNTTKISKTYTCNDCGRTCKTKTGLIKHIKCHLLTTKQYTSKEGNIDSNTKEPSEAQSESDLFKSKDKCHKCLKCKYETGNIEHMKRHQRVHTGERPFKCNICDYAASAKYGLLVHMRRHTGEKPYKCTVCQYKCSDIRTLNRHVKIHTQEKLFQCNVCDYKCIQKSALAVHLRRHTGEKPFKCNFCEYASSAKQDLRVHTRIHTGEKPYTCTMCKFKCSDGSSLKKHERIHTQEDLYKCNLCDYKCIHKTSLVVHLSKHTGEKPFKCSTCHYKSASKSGLTQHLKIHNRKQGQPEILEGVTCNKIC